MPASIDSLPFCFRRTPEYRGTGPEYPPQVQPHHPLTPQKQKVRQPTVEEGAVPRCRTKTTGDIPPVWASPSVFDSPFTSQQQTTPQIKIQTPAKTKWASSPPTTPPRRYTPQVTDFALPRHRRYRLSLQWKPLLWDEEDPKAKGSPLQEIFPISYRDPDNTLSSQCPRNAGAPLRRKLIYSFEEHPRRRRRYTDGMVDRTKTE
ncbi:hypothetical protein L211DRAFT_572640 [Terfezia boudieri ATCC MYA-4762]|uniref:Uncharacterized protein n=1 Tax=Terfezia boudieri ATCC MYA-4762 TaxID=1051890 RepID=A0A3N4LF91_9PEZI|nr:hypothetical protein L211DRAFT_572640 [Terfezia boudieri ATCC MYA-4762]